MIVLNAVELSLENVQVEQGALVQASSTSLMKI